MMSFAAFRDRRHACNALRLWRCLWYAVLQVRRRRRCGRWWRLIVRAMRVWMWLLFMML